MFLDPLRAPAPGAMRGLCVAFAVCFPCLPAAAQSAAPNSTAASSPGAEMTPAERAKRDADSVFRWITIHADKPRKADKPPVKEEKPPTVVRLKPPAATPVAATAAPAAPGVAPAAAPVVASNAPAAKPDAATPAYSPGSTPATAAELVAQRAPVSAPSAAVVNAPPVAAEEEDTGDTLTLVSQVEPKFPISVVRSQRSGQVQVRFTVLTDGSVSDVNVVTTSNMRLNSAALAAVAQWRFAPVRKPQQGVVDLGFTNPD
jgi:TonB family protein